MTIFGKKVHIIFSLFLWALVWEVVGHTGWFDIFPPLTEIFKAGLEIVPTDKFHNAMSITLHAYFVGMGLAVLIGIPLGSLMGYSKVVDQLVGTWVNIFVSAPLTAIVPVLMVLFGIGQTTVIASVFMFAIWVIVLDTRAGVKSVNPSLPEMAFSFGANGWTVFTRIYLLAALPEVLAGIRMGLIRAVKGVVIGQLLVAIMGIGELFELYSRNFLFEEFWALLLMVFAFAFATAEAVGYVERRVEFYASAR
ncbi:MAG: ABC transporter permease subunit [Rhodospirillales bacterium]|nr:ABC transporter permease subunit [Rhodospirillales bacterium]